MSDQDISPEAKTDLELEIGHLLFIDVVGYSKLLVNEQVELLKQLNRLVRATESFRRAEAEGKLIRLPTGDGMVLLFSRSPEEPVKCALEINEALRGQPHIQLRMGVHSGPVNQVLDVNDQINMAGAAINVGQRVMDCGDAGHILISKHVAEDLAEFSHWLPWLHDLGECEVKHGLRLHVFNLAKDGAGNSQLPQKFRHGRRWKPVSAPIRPVYAPRWPQWALVSGVVLSGVTLAITFLIFFRKTMPITGPASSEVLSDTGRLIIAKSIAVLPFENLSADQESGFFTDGIQDEILTDLAQVADLKVISRTSAMQYRPLAAKRNLRDIARQLGVAHVVEGTVQIAGNRVRVSAQLIDARTDMHLWAHQYIGDLADVFAIQSEIAKTIADQLQAKISPSEKAAIEKAPTADLLAYKLYLHARALFADTSDPIHARQKLPKAAQLLEEATTRDPQFLAAWCLLSRVHSVAYFRGHDHTPARLDLARAALEAGARIQPDAGEVHLAYANYYYHGFRDYGRARTELTIARRTLPNNSDLFLYTGFIDRRESHWKEATHNFEQALELDPRNFFILQQLALAYHWQRRYADEARTYDQALTIVPADPNTRILRALVALDWQADIVSFQRTLASLVDENPFVAPDIDIPLYALCERTASAAIRTLANYPREGVVNNGVNFPYAYWEGVVARSQGNAGKARTAFTVARKEVEKTLDEQPDFAAALSLLGMIDAGLGDKEKALSEGRRGCELLPISKDAVDGADVAINLARIYTWTGEKDRAIQQIAEAERVPNPLSYGLLKLNPDWDSLRGDPRFEKMVASLAPK